jgi:hypothetical protein
VEPKRQIIRMWAIRIAAVGVVLLIVLLVLYVISLLSGKSLWALLKVLAVPITVGAAVPLLNWLQKKRELEIAERRANDEALQAYLDKMTDLLVNHCLHKAPADKDELLADPVRVVAWARTKTGLRRLDGDGKGQVLRFLHEAGLIRKGCRRIHSLAKADLVKAGLRESSLKGVDLRGVRLRKADLSGADLSGADLSEPDLKDADLANANLSDANLSGAYLNDACLTGAYKVKNEGDRQPITGEELERQTKYLKGATMPDGSKHR